MPVKSFKSQKSHSKFNLSRKSSKIEELIPASNSFNKLTRRMSKVCSIDVEEAKKLHIDSSSEEEEDNSEDGITKASEYQIPEDGVGHFSQASNCSSGHANPSILARTAYLKQRQIMLKSSKKEVSRTKQ